MLINNYMIYLYIKTHNVTGLKYLGKTTQDPYKYKGSGKRWTNHINKHHFFTNQILLIIINFRNNIKTNIIKLKIFIFFKLI